MNILILSQYFWPETFRINELTHSLVKAGCSITVLTGPPNYPDGVVFPGYSAVQIKREIHRDGYPIYRIPCIPRGRAGALRLIANYTSFILSASLLGTWLLRGQTFDVIFVYAPSPILQAIPGIFLKRLKKSKLIIWVQDLWPQSLEVTGFVKNKTLLNLVKKMVRWIYRQSDLLMVQSRAFTAAIREISTDTPIEYFPNPGESELKTPDCEKPSLILEPGCFNVVFTGNLGKAQALDTILEAAEFLHSQEDVCFVLVGSGSQSEWLKSEIHRRGLRNVKLPGRFAAQAMPGILSQASALLVSLARNPIMSQTVPAKIQAYLAAGRPIIASLDGEGAKIVIEAGAGIACPAENARALAASVLAMRSKDKSELQAMGEAGRKFYKKHFDSDVLAEQLIEMLQKIKS